MANFHIAFEKTILHEGGYVSAARAQQVQDSGGETYMGISRNNNPEWAGWTIIDQYKATNGTPRYNFIFPASYGLTPLVEAQAKKKYWDTIYGDQISNQEVANLVFELYWMSGKTGIKQIQSAVNKTISSPILVDGVLGLDTLKAINAAPQSQLYSAIYNIRKSWYESKLASGNPNAEGWLKRLAAFPSQIFQASKEIARETIEVAKQNPTLTIIALLFFIGSAGLAYYHFFYSAGITATKIT